MPGASVAELNRRIHAVEAAVAPQDVALNPALPSHDTLSATVNSLSESWKTIQDANFKEFFDKYNSMASLLETDADLKELLISVDMKESILLAGTEDFQNTAGLLEAMKALQPSMSKIPIENLDDFEAQLAKAEATMAAKTEKITSMHTQVEEFLDQYNALISLLSQKFVQWDHQIGRAHV